MGDGAPLGALPKLKSHWVDIAHEVFERIRPHVNAAKRDHIEGLLDQFEADVAPKLAPFVAAALESPDVPDHVKELLRTVAGPEHFSESIIIGIAVGSILSPVLAAATQPIVQGIANTAWPTHPNLPLSPDLLAASVIKGVLTEPQAAGMAAVSGVDSDHFHTMVMSAGQSIGAGEALLLLRRKQINEAEFERIIRYSNVRNDFIPDVLKLMFAPPPAGEVIAGALKKHLPDAEAAKKLGEAGIDPANFDWMLATAGRPPGVESVVQLWNRGLATEADVDRTIAQSDVNPAFADLVKATRWYQVPPRSIVPMLRAGGITEARARELLTQHGVRAADQDAFIAEAHSTTSHAAKELTMSQVLTMYEGRFLDRPTAQTRLAALKYPADQIVTLLDYADEKRTIRLTDALIRQIGSLYISHKITKPAAVNTLDSAQVPTAVQADLFHVWDLERAAKAPNLTVAQWQGALRRELVTRTQFDFAMDQFGYGPNEIDLLAGLAEPPPHAAAKSKDLSVSQLTKLYSAGTITKQELLARLVAAGYSAGEANEIASLTPAPGP